MPKSRTTWSLLIGAALLAMLLVIGVVPRLRQNAELVAASTAPEAGLVPVSVVAPARATGPIDLVLPSNIQAIEEAAIYARTSGYVRERYVDIGDRVGAGKVLAQIDTPELDQELGQARAALAQTRSGLAQARASLVQAQATLNQARAGLDQSKTNEDFAGITAQRFTRLEHDGLVAHQDADEKRTGLAAAHATTAVSQANVDAMQANIGALEASVEAAQANVAANEANVQRLKALQSFQRVEAPFAGIITARGIDRGALITSGSGSGSIALFRIAHVENLRIFVNVPQTFVRSIVPGQEVRILVPEYPQRSSARSRTPRAHSIPPRAPCSPRCVFVTTTTRSCPGCTRRSSSASCPQKPCGSSPRPRCSRARPGRKSSTCAATAPCTTWACSSAETSDNRSRSWR